MYQNLEKMQQLHGEWEQKSLDELNVIFEGLSNEIVGLTEPITPEIGEAIKGFLQVVPFNSGFVIAAATVRLYDKLTAHEPTEEQKNIDIHDFRTFQKLLVDSKPTNMQQVKAVDTVLKATHHITSRLGLLEEQQRMISPIMIRKETELTTGLQFSEEDNKNVRPTVENTAKLNVVKDSESASEDETKTKKAPKAKAEKAKAEKK